VLNEQRCKLQLRHIWSRFFAGFDVLLCPLFDRPALPRMESGVRWDRQIRVGGAMVAHDEQLFWSGITCGFYLPSTVALIVRSRDGLPIGVQIVARPDEDRKTAPSTCGVGSAGFSPLGKAIRIYCQPMLQISAQT
jgi:Asp-tRNA(Asn)/Glu-tRNA(Gln) amidotransferase A subunit family amidase